jgi:long-subunit acyl-CoA synthetase (AMP-forming)
MQPNDCMTLIYTSGTTGNAKGVMLSHDNVISGCRASVLRVPSMGQAGQERVLSFMPLSHIAGANFDLYFRLDKCPFFELLPTGTFLKVLTRIVCIYLVVKSGCDEVVF